jgi:hypothetical protein
MWSKQDSQLVMDWSSALDWITQLNKDNYLGHGDWRLPNIKELQTNVDYTRFPQAIDSSY